MVIASWEFWNKLEVGKGGFHGGREVGVGFKKGERG